uniref:Secreted protein n=1 Tax=Oryza nivara TaxID=4536 RepID=A0A0E0J8V4_ORYNI
MSVFLFLFLFFLLLLLPPVIFLLSFFPCNNREREGALGLQWPGISDVGGNLCSRTTRIWGGWFPAEGDEELAGTAKELLFGCKGGGCGGCYGVGEKGKTGKMGSPEGGGVSGARI